METGKPKPLFPTSTEYGPGGTPFTLRRSHAITATMEFLMETRTNDEFRADIKAFDMCMLATKDGAHLRSRPMAPHVSAENASIRFLTSKKTHKIDEVKKNPNANAVFSNGDGLYISVSGRISLSDSRQDVDELWSPAAAPWFEDGKSEAVVLVLEPEIAEYWDNSDSKVKAGWEMVKGTLTGKRPDVGDHGKVDM